MNSHLQGSETDVQIDFLSLFPDAFLGFLDQLPFRFAIREGLIRVRVHNFCHWVGSTGSVVRNRTAGVSGPKVICAEPVMACVKDVVQPDAEWRTIVLSPRGRLFTQPMATEMCHLDQLVLICGRFGGFETGLAERIPAEEIAIGDYVLTGGELAAMVVADCVVRQLPGVIGE